METIRVLQLSQYKHRWSPRIMTSSCHLNLENINKNFMKKWLKRGEDTRTLSLPSCTNFTCPCRERIISELPGKNTFRAQKRAITLSPSGRVRQENWVQILNPCLSLRIFNTPQGGSLRPNFYPKNSGGGIWPHLPKIAIFWIWVVCSMTNIFIQCGTSFIVYIYM